MPHVTKLLKILRNIEIEQNNSIYSISCLINKSLSYYLVQYQVLSKDSDIKVEL